MNIRGVVIDPGHGGADGGATGNGIIEKDLTLKISNEMYNRLKSLGIPVYMTRTTDETVDPTTRVNRIMQAFGNNEDVIVISNHINAGGADGAEVIYALRNNSTFSDLVLRELAKAGQNVRKAYQRRLPSDTSKDYYFIHRDTGVTQPIIVEYGFLDSTGDDVNQLKNNYASFANAVVNAISQYIGAGGYTVVAGDSLWSIAKKFNTTVDQIKQLNNLSSNTLKIGQVLKIPTTIPIPEPSGEYKIYIVQAGDSLYQIANNNNTTVSKLMDYNNLTSTSLSIGQQIKIPTIATEPGGNYVNYTVQAGDSLYQIARKYNTTVDTIKSLNSLNTTLLSVGQVLKIPVITIQEEIPTTNYIEYKVQSGDSLYQIANKYGVTVDAIRTFNNLKSDLLSIGQIINIPIISSVTTYTVKSGDSLYQIANMFNTTVDAIKNKNNLTSNTLSIGQTLII